MPSAISERFEEVLQRITRAAEASRRDPEKVTLIAVGKTFPAEVVQQAVTAGALDLGPLQRNKARAALEVFDVVHTVDRTEIADRLQFLLGEHWPGRKLPVTVVYCLRSRIQRCRGMMMTINSSVTLASTVAWP